jgi:hypothetical protein
MNDIVARLRNWRTVHLARLHLLMEEAADEMERLRADWPEQLQAHSVLIAEQELEIERLRLSQRADCPVSDKAGKQDNGKTLTDAEREVLREVCRVYADEDDVGCNEIAYVIDRLLERFGPAANSTPIPRKDCGESRAGSDDETTGEDAAKCTVKSEKLPERDRLNEAEREAVEVAAEAYADDHGERFAATLRGLLSRLSPPAT